jgi:hypothetical protein
LAKVIGGVMVHRDCTRPFGFTLPEQRRDEANTRHVEAILTYLGTLDERRPEDRFALSMVVRPAAGVPAAPRPLCRRLDRPPRPDAARRRTARDRRLHQPR